MNRTDRLLLRAAGRMHEDYFTRKTDDSVPEPPEACWQLVQQADRQRRLCRNHHLPNAGRQAEERYLRQLDRLGSRCRDLVAVALAQAPPAEPPSLRSLYEDLLALRAEFEEVGVDLQKRHLTVRTEPIILEGVDLGAFEIRLDYVSLGDHSPYRVVALDPHPAGSDRETTHPHVHASQLCEGEAKLPIRSALQQGRIFDLFLLIRSVLQTYNSGSAYVSLADWEGMSCADCGGTTSPEDTSSCNGCQCELCEDCVRSCSSCSESLCPNCEHCCTGCDESNCSGCLSDCADCQDSFCQSCLEDNLCPSCLEAQQESEPDEDDPEDPTDPETTDPPSAAEEVPQTDPQVQPDRLVEALVPA
ncbi:hypothetical protein SH661x_002897 [Planctomicrobium sp. SH661]|uniref:hypothetical protein n=1 Tax=Planctomicrobium sp. SH661 TaxID=3448124 RepID=UPI003F5BB224